MYTKIIQRGILLAVVIVAGMAVVAQAQVGFPSRSTQVFDQGQFTTGPAGASGITGAKFLDSAEKEIVAVKGADKVWRVLIARGEGVKFTWNATGKIGGSTTPLPYCMNSFNNSNAVSGNVSGYFNAITDIRMVCIGLGGGVSFRRQVIVGNIDLTIPSVSVDGTRAQNAPEGTFNISPNFPVTVNASVKNIGEAPLRNYEVEVDFTYSLSKNDPGAGTSIDLVPLKTVGKGDTVPVPLPWTPSSTLFNRDVYIKACILDGTGPQYYEQDHENDCSGWSGPFRFISS